MVRVTAVTRLEIGFSARSGADLRDASKRPPLSAVPVEYLTPAIEDRAIEVQELPRFVPSVDLAGRTGLGWAGNWAVGSRNPV